MIAEYDIRFTLPDIGKVPDNFKDFLNILENLGMTDNLVKAEESVEHDLTRPYITLSRKASFRVTNKKEKQNDLFI